MVYGGEMGDWMLLVCVGKQTNGLTNEWKDSTEKQEGVVVIRQGSGLG